MFIYWDGYEIDGSDTDFSIVLPENVQLCELVESFMDIPLFDSNMRPDICYYKGNKRKEVTYEEMIQMLGSGNHHNFQIQVNCCHPEQLSDNLRENIYGISERRQPHEEAYGKVTHPCTPPLKQNCYDRGNMTVALLIGHDTVIGGDDEIDGYITNIELLEETDHVFPCVSLNVGPSFYYEYALYIVDYLRERFPSIATFGGLDCEGGWTYGCTYASSLYSYEKFELPVEYSVKNTLKRLSEYDILCPSVHYYQKGWKQERTKDFNLSKNLPYYMNADSIKQLKPLSFGEYADLAEQILSSGKDSFEMICETALEILIVKPENFSICPNSQKTLEEIHASCDIPENSWYHQGYFAFTQKDGKRIAEFRVYYKLTPYMQALLELMTTGKLEEIKQETYKRRYEE